MPELPEVETICRGLEPVLAGHHFVRVEQYSPGLRFPFPDHFSHRLIGTRVEQLVRRAKYLLAFLSNGDVLAMHLGMSGQFIIDMKGEMAEDGSRRRHTHITFKMSNGVVVDYHDPRRFGFMTLIKRNELATHKFFQGLGIEPLGEKMTPEFLALAAAGKTMPLKAFLMSQKIIAGLGNIYVCEALYRAHLSPRRKALTLAIAGGGAGLRAKRLTFAIRSVLSEAIKVGGSTLKDYRQTDGSMGYFQHAFSVYECRGESCKTSGCEGVIRRIVQNGRSTFYCPDCQR